MKNNQNQKQNNKRSERTKNLKEKLRTLNKQQINSGAANPNTNLIHLSHQQMQSIVSQTSIGGGSNKGADDFFGAKSPKVVTSF